MDLVQRLHSFIQSNETTALSVNKNNLNKPQHDTKLIESSCKKAIDNLIVPLSLDQTQSISLYFKSLYILYQNDYVNTINTIRNHQLLIVKLFESKLAKVVIQQLEIIHKQFVKLLQIHSSNFLSGIQYVKTEDEQMDQLIIAFHFFLLQAQLHYISKNLKNIIHGKDELLNLKWLEYIPNHFLSFSNLNKWQSLHKNEKYTKNTEKLIIGFIKIFDSVKIRKFVKLTNCLKIKLIHFTKDDSVLKDIELTPEVMYFLNDSNIHSIQETNIITTSMNDVESLEELKLLPINNENTTQIIDYLDGILVDTVLSNSHLSILDSLTIYLKDNIDLSSLQKLFNIYARFKQFKRLRNLTNILFTSDLQELSIKYELRIFKLKPCSENFTHILNKYKQCEVNQNILNMILEAYQLISDKKMMKTICSHLNPGLDINHLNDEVKFDLCDEILNLSNESVCNSIIPTISFENKQLQYQVQYNYYNTNINHVFFNVDTDNSLVKAGFQLQSLLYEFDQELCTDCIGNFKSYLNKEVILNDLDYKISRHLLLYFNYSKIDITFIVEQFLNKSITNEFKVFLQMISSKLTGLSQLMKNSNIKLRDVITYQLLQFDTNKNSDTYKKIHNIIRSRPEFDLSSSKNLPVIEKFHNFLILAKFQYLSHNFNQNPIDKYLNLKTAIQILFSIMKKCSSTVPRFDSLELKWEITRLLFDCYDSMIQVLIDLGLSKDIPFYIKEWRNLDHSNKIPIVNNENRIKINQYNQLINNESTPTQETKEIQFYPGLLQGTSKGELENINKLINLKDTLLSKFYQRPTKQTSHLLNQCILQLSSITISKDSELTSQLFFIEDYVKYLPFENEQIIQKNLQDGFLPLDPINIDTIEKKSHNFNIDLSLYIPGNYSIVTIDICSVTGDLLVSKYLKNNSPFFLRIPIGSNTFNQMRQSFNSIISKSNLLTKKITTSKVKTTDDRKNWWRLRFELDFELKDLLESVQQWFQGFIGIFETEDAILFPKFKKELQKVGLHYHDTLIKTILSINKEFLQDTLHLINITEKQRKAITILVDKYQKLRYQTTSNHTILIPSSKCLFFPWESLPMFENKSITRMTSIHQLLSQLKSIRKYDTSKVYYLLNPSGDLKNSENRFKQTFKSNPGWAGKIGDKPKEEEFLSNLSHCDYFIYIGHGGCEQFFKPSNMFKSFTNLNKKIPPSLLIGCSSGGLDHMGDDLEPSASFFNWINNQTPMMLANLWDVTDKDIDLFTMSTLERFGLIGDESGQDSISEAVMKSRSKCVLKHLNGSAPIIYGLPIPK